jgi:uncharacterized membrane protein
VRVQNLFVLAFVCLISLEGPAQAPPQKPAAKPPVVQAPEAVPAPTSKHYPILIIAHGSEPFWSLRLGMKGPERLDRVGYPPMVLEPGEITREESGSSWTYKAKDVATGANVAVKLTREPCSDNLSETKYTFSLIVDHAQVGSLKGCGLSSPDKFPEFRKKNQLDQDDDTSDKDKDKDKDKKTGLDPITNFHSPTAVAYLDAAGRVMISRGEVRKAVASSGSELALSHDGKMLLYTRSDSKTGPERSLVLYEVDTGRSRDFAGNNVRQAFWSPDDAKVAFLKFDGKIWQVWTAPFSAPETAALLFSQNIDALHGWASPNSVLATDLENAYWLSDDKPPETIPLKDIYGDTFQIMSSDTIRVCPVNPDLLLVSAYYAHTPAGAPTDSMGLNSTFFLYEVRSRRRVVLGPTTEFARAAEWSRDGLQIFYTAGASGKTPSGTNRIFWDGSGEKRYSGGSYLVVGK